MTFTKPEKSVTERTKPYTTCYTDPIISIIYWNKIRNVFNYLKNRTWKVTLEVGCGFGFFLPSLCQISDKVIGSDLKETFESYGKITLRKIKEEHANLELKEIDARYLSTVISKESCDVIVAVSVLEHITEYKKAIEDVSKCLKPQGIFICVLPTENTMYKIGRKIIGYPSEYHKGYSYKEVRTYLSKNLREVKTWFSPFHLPLFFHGVYQKPINQNILNKDEPVLEVVETRL